MTKKITWIETFSTVCKYSAEITDEEAALFEEDEDKFFDEVNFRDYQNLEWEKIGYEDSYDFEIEDSE